jgi:hypothetical protein
MSHHRLIARAVETLKNTPENLTQIANLILALMCEYLIRYKQLRVEGKLPENFSPFVPLGGEEDDTKRRISDKENGG